MSKLKDLEAIKNETVLEDGSIVCHAKGNIDDWCVYLIFEENPDATAYSYGHPKVLEVLKLYVGQDGSQFLEYYDQLWKEAGPDLSDKCLDQARFLAKTYCTPQQKIKSEALFTMLYYMLISEFHWKKSSGVQSRATKWIQRASIYALIELDEDPQTAADCCKKKSVEEVREFCEQFDWYEEIDF